MIECHSTLAFKVGVEGALLAPLWGPGMKPLKAFTETVFMHPKLNLF